MLFRSGAARTAVTGVHDGRLRLAVAAPPSDGRANRAVEELLAALCGVAPRRVRLVRGDRSRAKTLWLGVDDAAEALARLLDAVGVDRAPALDGACGPGADRG
mgnify:FL=1